MPKLTHPAITSFSHGGQTYDANERGEIDLPDEAVAVALMHGFANPSAEVAAFQGPTPDDLKVDLAAAQTEIEDLRKQLADAAAAKAALERELETAKAELAKVADVVAAKANIELELETAKAELAKGADLAAAKAALERELETVKADLAKSKKAK